MAPALPQKPKRVYTKRGDVFVANIDNEYLQCLQLIAFDVNQLNSDVIRVFKTRYPVDTKLKLADVIQDEVAFYAHTTTSAGVKLGLWSKLGYIAEVGELHHILFKDTNDHGEKIDGQPILVSENWYVWKLTTELEPLTKIGRMTPEYQHGEIGLVFAPHNIIHRIKTGEYPLFNYPS